MVKAHVISRLEKEQSQALVEVLEGFGPFLEKHAIVVYGKSQVIKDNASYLLDMLHSENGGEIQKQLVRQLDSCIGLRDQKDMSERRAALDDIKSQQSPETTP
jgi:hypothetical protein